MISITEPRAQMEDIVASTSEGTTNRNIPQILRFISPHARVIMPQMRLEGLRAIEGYLEETLDYGRTDMRLLDFELMGKDRVLLNAGAMCPENPERSQRGFTSCIYGREGGKEQFMLLQCVPFWLDPVHGGTALKDSLATFDIYVKYKDKTRVPPSGLSEPEPASVATEEPRPGRLLFEGHYVTITALIEDLKFLGYELIVAELEEKARFYNRRRFLYPRVHFAFNKHPQRKKRVLNDAPDALGKVCQELWRIFAYLNTDISGRQNLSIVLDSRHGFVDRLGNQVRVRSGGDVLPLRARARVRFQKGILFLEQRP